MFDMLTTGQLLRLHSNLYDTATRVHHRMIGPDGQPLISVFGGEWAVLAACHAEISETQWAIGDELHRRRAEETNADA